MPKELPVNDLGVDAPELAVESHAFFKADI